MKSEQAEVNSTIILSSCIPSPRGLPYVLVMKHLQGMGDYSSSHPIGSQPAFAWNNVAYAQSLSSPLQASICFFQHPLPAALTACLAAYFPTEQLVGRLRAYHVSCKYQQWVRPRLYAGGSSSATGYRAAPVPDHLPFGPSLSAPLACLS